MSVERVKGELVFTCDECDDTLETGTDEFAEGLQELKDAGWGTGRTGTTWVHRCPTCQPPGWRSRL
jgi:hypothetical protein